MFQMTLVIVGKLSIISRLSLLNHFPDLFMRIIFALLTLFLIGGHAHAMDECGALPKTIKVKKKSSQCGKVPTVVLKGKSRGIFSAAFRWDDGSDEGQDRSPFALNDSSASSSPYKTQRKVRGDRADYLCYGKFLGRKGYQKPEQLTVKPSVMPKVVRYCVAF